MHKNGFKGSGPVMGGFFFLGCQDQTDMPRIHSTAMDISFTFADFCMPVI